MNFRNNPRFAPEVEQKIRETLAKSRTKLQAITEGIYPETSQVKIETQLEKTVNEKQESAQDHVEEWDYQP